MFAAHAALHTVGAAGDPYANNVVFLLKANSDGSFSDVSKAAHTINMSGTVGYSTSIAKFGGVSAYFDNSGGYLSSPDSNDWDFGTGDFTVEMWSYLITADTNKALISTYQNATTGWEIQHNQYSGYSFTRGDSPGVYPSSIYTTTGSWAHVAVCRNGTNLRFFVDGVQKGSVTNSTDISGSSSALIIGNFATYFNQKFHGYLQDLRITKGFARYTGNFTPPGSLV